MRKAAPLPGLKKLVYPNANSSPLPILECARFTTRVSADLGNGLKFALLFKRDLLSRLFTSSGHHLDSRMSAIVNQDRVNLLALLQSE
jgi:hypothetical protein